MNSWPTKRYTRAFLTVLALLTAAYKAQAVDVFTSPNILNVPTLRVGSATYSDVVLTLRAVVAAPSGRSPNGAEDIFDPVTRELTVPTVRVGKKTYFNVIVAVAHLTSIGSVNGADTFDGASLTIPYMLIGTTPYYNVLLPLSLSDGARVFGGLPRVTWDQFDPTSNKLAIPAIKFGDQIYTNVILDVKLSKFDFVGVTESVLYSFHAQSVDGVHPHGSLIQASDGSFYGMTAVGGVYGFGAVIKITPAGTESVLSSLGGDGADAIYPAGSLIQATDGNFYGMTPSGGANGAGAAIRITPGGTESVLYSFGYVGTGDGFGPFGSLVQATDGNFYGMTYDGGTNNAGAVVRITPAGTESVLHSFGAFVGDGISPKGNLIQASDGNLYGMTMGGGTNGNGAVIKITLAGSESVMHSFGSAGDGAFPQGDLIQASDGNFYGMTWSGGAIQNGAVIKITPGGVESVLYSLSSISGDGWNPIGNLVEASDGNFYGMTPDGGAHGYGAIIRITSTGAESVLHSFTGPGGDGYMPNGNLIQAIDGNLYGMTWQGGANSEGAVIKINW